METFKVFISSTSQDLARYRAIIIDQLRRMQQPNVAMEFFGSRPADALAVSLDEVRNCNLFIGIYGFRYGFTPGNGTVSITEAEFRTAFDEGRRCLCYLADPSTAPESSDEEEWKQKALVAFKKRIDTELVRSFFTTAEDLARKIAADVASLREGTLSGYSHRDLLKRWAARGEETQDRLTRKELHGRRGIVDPPLSSHWDQFITRRPWHEKIAQALKDIAGGADKVGGPVAALARRVRALDCSLNYDALLTRLGELITDRTIHAVSGIIQELERDFGHHGGARSGEEESPRLTTARHLRRDLLDIRDQVKEPEFARCFLVTGSLGSGKTHFITSLLGSVPDGFREQFNAPHDPSSAYVPVMHDSVSEESPEARSGNESDESHEFTDDNSEDTWQPDNENYLVLWLAGGYQHEPLEQLILPSLYEASGLQWRSLFEFNRFLEDFGRLPERNLPISNLRLVIAIDDLQKWSSLRGPEATQELLDFISSSTQCHTLYWLLALHYTSYGEIADQGRAWEQYGFVYRSPDVASEPSGDLSGRASELSIGGWLPLDLLNSTHQLGFQILRAFLTSYTDQVFPALDALGENEAAMRNLANPFIAWILIELCEEGKIDLENLATLNYIEFVNSFWKKRSAEIDPAPLSREDLSQSIKLAAQVLVRGELAPLAKEFEKQLAEAAEKQYEIKPAEFAKAALDVLVRGNLLETIRVTDPSSSFYIINKVALRFETFWELHLAVQLQMRESLEREDKEAVRRELEAWFASVLQTHLAEGVFQFLLLLLATDSARLTKSGEFVKGVFQMGLESQILPAAAVWFAGAKAEHGIQQALAEMAAARLGDYSHRHSLFGFMYFLSEALPEVLKLPARVQLLSPHYKAIFHCSLSSYFSYIVERLLLNVHENAVVLACMKHLAGCEVMQIAPEIAQMIVERLVANAKEQNQDVEDLLGLIIDYLQSEAKRAKAGYKARGSVKEWNRFFFREWVLYEFCTVLANKRGIGAFHLLAKHSWYRTRKLKIDYPVSKEMDQEANLALGQWYRTTHRERERKSYVDKVEKLSDSKNPRDRETAFYLIRHTKPTRGESGVYVDSVFHNILKKIFFDPKLDRLVRRFYDTFRYNLDNFPSLESKRRRMLRSAQNTYATRNRRSPG